MSHASNPPVPDAMDIAEAIRTGRTSAEQVLEEAIARIEEHNPALNAVVATRYDEARAEVAAGLPDGPLRGVPFLVKNLGTDVAGIASTGGSRLKVDSVPTRDSELVRRYRAAGLVVLGVTNTPEFGLNASTESALFGPARNPRDTSLSTGGSSGGSGAAVAAGMVPVAHGNDGGGSVRIPAAINGLFGLKPSRGRITSYPDPSTLSGPVSIDHALTMSVRDSALLLDLTHGPLPGEALAAPSPRGTFLDATYASPGRLRIGLMTSLVNGPETDPQCVAAARAAADLCASLGHEIVELATPWDTVEVAVAQAIGMGVNLVVGIDEYTAARGQEVQPGELEPFTEFLVGEYRKLPATAMTQGLRQAQSIGWQVGAAFADVDVLLSPTTCVPTLALGVLDTTDVEVMYEKALWISGWTGPFNLTGMPAMSVPLARDERGLPLGVQFAADLGQEELLFSLAAQLETAAPWQRRAPGYGVTP